MVNKIIYLLDGINYFNFELKPYVSEGTVKVFYYPVPK
jgi:hypothetical protein